MKKKTLSILIAVSIFSFGLLQAQDHKNKVAVSLLGGLAVPAGNFASINSGKGNAKTGYTLGGSVEYFFKEKVSLGINFMYNSFDDKDASSIKNRIVSYGLVGRYILNSHPEVDYYLRFGLGLAKFKIEESDSTKSYDLKPAVAAGLGFSYELTSSLSLFGEAIFNHVVLENAEYSIGGMQQSALGYNLQHFGIYTGLVFYIKTKQPDSSYQ